jgi:CheY-like chemotaxis protein
MTGNPPFIFLAEDDIDDQELLIEAINTLDKNIEIKAVNNGKKAVCFLEELQPELDPSLIVLDYNLPEMSGAEILERLNELNRFKHINKLVWRTSNSPLYEDLCLSLGANAYVVKPSDLSGINRLAQLMLEMCRNKSNAA